MPEQPPLRVLVVDDEPAILFAYQKLIRANGFCVDTCSDLDDALALIETKHYSAVITDIRLSGTENIGGVLLVQAARKLQPDAKLIVVTGFGNSSVELALRELGVCHYFEKPVMPSLIMELLKAIHVVDEDDDFALAFPEPTEAEYF